MTKYQITPKKLAVFLHNTYEKEAKNLGWKTQKSCRSKKFSELPLENQQLMIFVADKIIRKLQSYGKGYDDFNHSYVISEDWLLNLDEVAPNDEEL
jgi:hypothetical protein